VNKYFIHIKTKNLITHHKWLSNIVLFISFTFLTVHFQQEKQTVKDSHASLVLWPQEWINTTATTTTIYNVILHTRCGCLNFGRKTETAPSFTVKPQDVHRFVTSSALQLNQLAKRDNGSCWARFPTAEEITCKAKLQNDTIFTIVHFP